MLLKNRFAAIFLAGMLVLQGCSFSGTATPTVKDTRPNFLIIISDDQRFDTMQYMPQTQALIFDQGATFTHGYITTPLCCPSRASILTGLYAHDTNVRENNDKMTKRTFMEDLHANGYTTGLVGKYLNSWKGEQRPEFDFWVSFFKGESRYDDPPLNVNGKWSKHTGYITDILGDYSSQFITESASKNKPFALIFAPNAPHVPATPYAGDQKLYTDLAPFRPPSFNEADTSDKNSWFQNRPLLTEAEIKDIDTFRRNQILTLVALDRAVGKVMGTLKQSGQLDNTVVIYISDNGLFWGEHRITSKNSFYEEAIKVPFALRYPALVPKPCKEDRLVANIDIAPTIYDLAKLSTPGKVDGLSMAKLFNGGEWRTDLLIEGWPPRGTYAVLRSGNYAYGETVGDRTELYDLVKDPYQLTNIADDPANQALMADFKKRLDAIREPPGVPTPDAGGTSEP